MYRLNYGFIDTAMTDKWAADSANSCIVKDRGLVCDTFVVYAPGVVVGDSTTYPDFYVRMDYTPYSASNEVIIASADIIIYDASTATYYTCPTTGYDSISLGGGKFRYGWSQTHIGTCASAAFPLEEDDSIILDARVILMNLSCGWRIWICKLVERLR